MLTYENNTLIFVVLLNNKFNYYVRFKQKILL